MRSLRFFVALMPLLLLAACHRVNRVGELHRVSPTVSTAVITPSTYVTRSFEEDSGKKLSDKSRDVPFLWGTRVGRRAVCPCKTSGGGQSAPHSESTDAASGLVV